MYSKFSKFQFLSGFNPLSLLLPHKKIMILYKALDPFQYDSTEKNFNSAKKNSWKKHEKIHSLSSSEKSAMERSEMLFFHEW